MSNAPGLLNHVDGLLQLDMLCKELRYGGIFGLEYAEYSKCDLRYCTVRRRLMMADLVKSAARKAAAASTKVCGLPGDSEAEASLSTLRPNLVLQ